MIKWTATKKEMNKITTIVRRARALGVGDNTSGKMMMDFEACHCNGTPLDLGKIIRANNLNFIHDVCGIQRHLDRDTGQLTGFFLPRGAAVLKAKGQTNE